MHKYLDLEKEDPVAVEQYSMDINSEDTFKEVKNKIRDNLDYEAEELYSYFFPLDDEMKVCW